MVTISVPTGPSVLLSGVKNEDIWFALSAVYLIFLPQLDYVTSWGIFI